MQRRFWGLGLAVAALASTVVTTVHASSGGAPVTLTIGLMQDLDSPNVTVGALVADYELWNMQYATLTDKAADDFSNIPGLAESWEASADGLTYTYKLRAGLKWSDGEPLTADDVVWTINTSKEQEWINHFATTQNLTATADRRHDGADRHGRARPEAADDGRLHPAQAHLGGAGEDRHHRVRRARRRRLGSVHAEVAQRPAGLDDGRQPQLLAWRPEDRPGRVPRVHRGQCDGRRAEER